MRSRRRLGALACASIFAYCACVLALSGCKSSELAAPKAALGQRAGGPVPIDADDAVFGYAEAPLTLVLFLNYEHNGSRSALETAQNLYARFPYDVRYVIKHYAPCDYPRSQATARAAAAVLALAGPRAYFEFVREALKYRERISPEFLRRLARDVGVPEDRLGELTHPRFTDKVQRDMELAAALEVARAPTTVMNGLVFIGPIAEDVIEEEALEELKTARPLKLAGQPARRIYEKRTQVNRDERRARIELDAAAEPTPPVVSAPAPRDMEVGGAPAQGSSSAPVTVLSFLDFGSGCSAPGARKLEELRAKYGADLRVAFKHAPWSNRSYAAAGLAEYARAVGGDSKFFEAAALLWQAEQKLDDRELERMAITLGLDPQAALAAVHDNTYVSRIEQDSLAAANAGVRSEPGFLVNRQLLFGSGAVAELDAAIAAQLATARANPAGSPVSLAAAPASVAASAGGDAQAAAAAAVPALEAPADLPFRGAPDAPIVLQVFTSFNYAACRIPREIEAQFVAHPGRVKLVFRPLVRKKDEFSKRLAEAALEAHAQLGNPGFWYMAKLLCNDYMYQSYGEKDELADYAKRINLDVARFEAALADHRHVARIDASSALAEAHGLDDDPAYVLNGAPLGGPGRYLRMKVKLSELLAGTEASPR